MKRKIPKIDGEFDLKKSLEMFGSCRIENDFQIDKSNTKYIVVEAYQDCPTDRAILLKKIDEYLDTIRGINEYSENQNRKKKLKELEAKFLSMYPTEEIQ